MAAERMHQTHGTGGRKKKTGKKLGRPKTSADKKEAARDAKRYQQRKADEIGRAAKESTIEIDTSPEADKRRADYCIDPKAVYNDFVAETVRNRVTGVFEKRKLGRFHDYFLDFLFLDMEGVKVYSPLRSHLPAKDEKGDYPETWLFFKTLDSVPLIQYGAQGELATAFYKTFWQGLIIKVCGDARTKCALTPRDHLKSTIGGVLQTLVRMINDPSDRHVIRSGRSNLAKQFLDGIKSPFMYNDDFRRLWGNLIPSTKDRDCAWNTERIQLKIPREQRRGNDPTVQVGGKGTDLVGTHGDHYIPDDLVNQKNSTNETQLEATCELMSAMQANREPDSNFTDIGTRWHDDDAHGFFVGEPGKNGNKNSGSFAEYSCFFVATVLDGDETVKVPPLKNGFIVTQLGHGKPIWPEGFNLRTIQQRRSGMPEDRLWNGQFFNQFIGTSDRIFKREWIRNIPPTPCDECGRPLNEHSMIELVEHLKLNCYGGIDTASGKEIQTKALDHTAALVIGQTPDRNYNYMLDGFREKIPAEQISLGIVDLGVKWNAITRRAGTIFRLGVEETPYTEFLHVLLESELKRLSPRDIFPIEPMKCKSAHKADRIRQLAPAYTRGEYFWPEKLMVQKVRLTEKQMKPKEEGGQGLTPGEPYDLRIDLEDEFVGYHPNATVDGLLDGHVYASRLALPSDWAQEEEKAAAVAQRGQYFRDEVESGGRDFGGYEAQEMERPY